MFCCIYICFQLFYLCLLVVCFLFVFLCTAKEFCRAYWICNKPEGQKIWIFGHFRSIFFRKSILLLLFYWGILRCEEFEFEVKFGIRSGALLRICHLGRLQYTILREYAMHTTWIRWKSEFCSLLVSLSSFFYFYVFRYSRYV